MHCQSGHGNPLIPWLPSAPSNDRTSMEGAEARFFLLPAVIAAVISVFKVLLIQFIQFLPQVVVELFQAEILPFLQVMEDSFFKDTNGVFYGAFAFVIGNYR